MSTSTDTTVTGAVGGAAQARGGRDSLWHRLNDGRTNYDFVRGWKKWFAGSLAVILLGLVGLIGFGLNRSIDFTGGTVWEVKGSASEAAVKKAVGLDNVRVQTIGGDTLRVQARLQKGKEAADREAVTTKLAKLVKRDARDVNVSFVGPSWGKDVSKKAQRALVFFFLIIAAYISLRFEWRMATAALIAVLHDILITVGIYSLTRFEVTPATVIAFLTILGFSLYDTIVVFDKLEENVRSYGGTGKVTYTELVNLSMNQVLMRSLNTSFVAILPIVSLLVVGAGILGASALGDFGLALFIGLLTGAYSSIFIAAPVLALLKAREPRWKAISERHGGAGGGIGDHGLEKVLDDDEALRQVAGGRAPRGRKLGRTR